MDPTTASPVLSDGKPQRWDVMFLILLAASLIGSVYVGMLAYQQASKSETTKRTAEAIVAWFGQQAADRASETHPHVGCAAQAGATWHACLPHFLGEEGPLHGRLNAFNGGPVRILTACSTSDRSVAGDVVLELVTPLPPGAAIPFTVAPLTPEVSIAQKATLRVAACDRDGSIIRVGETEF